MTNSVAHSAHRKSASDALVVSLLCLSSQEYPKKQNTVRRKALQQAQLAQRHHRQLRDACQTWRQRANSCTQNKTKTRSVSRADLGQCLSTCRWHRDVETTRIGPQQKHRSCSITPAVFQAFSASAAVRCCRVPGIATLCRTHTCTNTAVAEQQRQSAVFVHHLCVRLPFARVWPDQCTP